MAIRTRGTRYPQPEVTGFAGEKKEKQEERERERGGREGGRVGEPIEILTRKSAPSS